MSTEADMQQLASTTWKKWLRQRLTRYRQMKWNILNAGKKTWRKHGRRIQSAFHQARRNKNGKSLGGGNSRKERKQRTRVSNAPGWYERTSSVQTNIGFRYWYTNVDTITNKMDELCARITLVEPDIVGLNQTKKMHPGIWYSRRLTLMVMLHLLILWVEDQSCMLRTVTVQWNINIKCVVMI